MLKLLPIVFIWGILPSICTISAAEFDATAEAHTGYETGVFDPADSLFSASPLVSVLAEPVMSFDLGSQLKAKISAEIYTAYRFSAQSDFNAGPAFSIARDKPQGSTEWGLSLGYYTLPGSVDFDQPMDYWLYSFTAASIKKQKNPFKLSYNLTVLDGSTDTRFDVKNKLKVKKTFRISRVFSPSLGTGIGFNLSNLEGYSYGEVDALASNYALFHERHMFMTMLYFTHRIFGSEETGNGARTLKNVKKTHSATTVNMLSTSIVTAIMIYVYEIHARCDIEVQYSYKSSRSDFSLNESSHQILAGFAWRLRDL